MRQRFTKRLGLTVAALLSAGVVALTLAAPALSVAGN
jgi:hypothetical protein